MKDYVSLDNLIIYYTTYLSQKNHIDTLPTRISHGDDTFYVLSDKYKMNIESAIPELSNYKCGPEELNQAAMGFQKFKEEGNYYKFHMKDENAPNN